MRFLQNKSLSLLAALAVTGLMPQSAPAAAVPGSSAFIEAESFENYGGWVMDTQFIEIMGSPYLMAHGLGRPVKDAETTVAKAPSGKVQVWVRTKNWVGPWKAPGAPGRFQVSVNGTLLKKERRHGHGLAVGERG